MGELHVLPFSAAWWRRHLTVDAHRVALGCLKRRRRQLLCLFCAGSRRVPHITAQEINLCTLDHARLSPCVNFDVFVVCDKVRFILLFALPYLQG